MGILYGVLRARVHVFNSEGDFLRTIHSPSPKSSGSFGSSIDANDDFILIAEFGDWTSNPNENGSVYVYNRERARALSTQWEARSQRPRGNTS